jgi:hypothetical protein
MVVRAGREFLPIPGPTTVPDEVLRAIRRPTIDIYAGPLLALPESLLADLSRLFCTNGRSYIYIANGHGAREAALTNVLSRVIRFWCWKAVGLQWDGAMRRPFSAPTWRSFKEIGVAPSARSRGPAEGR